MVKGISVKSQHARKIYLSIGIRLVPIQNLIVQMLANTTKYVMEERMLSPERIQEITIKAGQEYAIAEKVDVSLAMYIHRAIAQESIREFWRKEVRPSLEIAVQRRVEGCEYETIYLLSHDKFTELNKKYGGES